MLFIRSHIWFIWKFVESMSNIVLCHLRSLACEKKPVVMALVVCNRYSFTGKNYYFEAQLWCQTTCMKWLSFMLVPVLSNIAVGSLPFLDIIRRTKYPTLCRLRTWPLWEGKNLLIAKAGSRIRVRDLPCGYKLLIMDRRTPTTVKSQLTKGKPIRYYIILFDASKHIRFLEGCICTYIFTNSADFVRVKFKTILSITVFVIMLITKPGMPRQFFHMPWDGVMSFVN